MFSLETLPYVYRSYISLSTFQGALASYVTPRVTPDHSEAQPAQTETKQTALDRMASAWTYIREGVSTGSVYMKTKGQNLKRVRDIDSLLKE